MHSLSWLSRDGKLLLAARPIQSFSNSLVSVFLAIFLNLVGLPLWQIGLVLTGGLFSSTLFNLITGFLADHMGRRRMLLLFSLITTVSGAVFASVSNLVVLVLVAIVSAIGYRGRFGPSSTLERVILAQCCSADRRTGMYSMRSALNSLATAAGSLFIGVVVIFQSLFEISEIASYRLMFWVFALLNLGAFLLYSLLSSEAEVEISAGEESPPLSSETKSIVMKISLLFGMDAFGGGLITSTLVSFWFFKRFGLNINIIGVIFSVSSLLSAVSFMLAARISDRIGLINTMVYSHLPANMMTMSIPYMPTLATSITLYMSRALLSQMDVPTRQSYTMAIVKPEERSRVAGLINLPRSLTMAISPALAGFIMQFVGMSLPFLIAGSLKAVYDLALYFTFKDIKPPEEE